MNSILEEDIKNIADSKLVNWEEFNNKSILITGATGLICSIMIKAFCKKKLNLKEFSGEGDNYITDEVVKNISKMSSLLGEKTFRLKSTNEGIFALFGNENQTIDNGLIQISDIVENIEFKDRQKSAIKLKKNNFKSFKELILFFI